MLVPQSHGNQEGLAVSTIFTPMPPPQIGALTIPADASWWRLALPMNDDGNVMVQRSDATTETQADATWMTVEFFDGETTTLDDGLDAPNVWEIRFQANPPSPRIWLDLLTVGQPTPAADWKPLTDPGDRTHPDDEDARRRYQ